MAFTRTGLNLLYPAVGYTSYSQLNRKLCCSCVSFQSVEATVDGGITVSASHPAARPDKPEASLCWCLQKNNHEDQRILSWPVLMFDARQIVSSCFVMTKAAKDKLSEEMWQKGWKGQ